MSLTARDTELTELMDDPSCDREQLRRTLRRFAIVNRAVSGWGTVYRSHLRPLLAAADGPVRILEIGCGGGDVLRRVVRRARREGFAVSGVGIDPDERALEVAHEAPMLAGVEYRRQYSTDLVREGARFDVVISNHLLHHLGPAELQGVLADSEALGQRLSLHADILRGRAAYAAYAVGITPLAPGSLLRTDGLRSIRRSYTAGELDAVLPHDWVVEQPVPFRLLAVHRGAEKR